MRIAMVSPLAMRVPPVAYGGTELIVSLLTEELVRRGHEVTLFASGDSVTSARLVSVCPHYLNSSGRNASILDMLNMVTCLEQADRFDIIHAHTCFEGMALAGLVKTPMLTTIHINLDGDWFELFRHYKGWYNTISRSAKSLLPDKERFVGVIYNAIDVKSYPFNGAPRKPHLLFLSRISYQKGPHLAIQVARRLGRRLIIAGNVHPHDEEYFRTMVMPEVDGDLIQYVGEADYHRKRELLSQAYCLVAPITWEEPFGLFFIEAMACGTPVVVFNRGSAPEVVKHGETGYVVDTLEEMAAAVDEVYRIDRRRCREYVEENFDAPRMADDYLRAYERILSEQGELMDIGAAASAERLLENTVRFTLDSEASDKVTTARN
ncbi:MAG TPA: glycosyltransferase family 4 protein [Dehalococcoidia bacterium]|jgi:glycosyltransferase involved in cell wall biosynthesis|nr:glycosyltransferase family 4 protein [Dehalococcoidia bacterium]